jgi:bifunctional N-acetylglucosamine-1-phosphate-uridyltransferase/glucosamine-1-phosphate-acetyltransferase GlmU-like protein
VELAHRAGKTIVTVTPPDPDDQMGINDLAQLRRAEAYLRRIQHSTLDGQCETGEAQQTTSSSARG